MPILGKIFSIHAITLFLCSSIIVLCDELHNYEASGSGASFGEFPAMASVINAVFNIGHICCGTIMTTNYIVTAASCYEKLPPKLIQNDLFVIIGAILLPFANIPREQLLQVKKILYHPNYNHTTLNDIALLYIRDKIKFVANIVSNIPIANEKTPPIRYGTVCQTAGWGFFNSNNQKESEQLRQLMKYDIKVVHDARCLCSNETEECYQDGFCMSVVSKSILCFGFGGNPLICDGVLFGIRTNGHQCMDEENGIIFLAIDPYFDWIKSVVKTQYKKLNSINTSNKILAMDLWSLLATAVALKL